MLDLFLDPNPRNLTSLPSVAVVILNWNGRHFLEKFLPHLLASTYPGVQFVVADNGSHDQSVSWLKTNYPTVRVIELGENTGFAEGYNLALQQVDAGYYILLNSDVEVNPGWIEPMVHLMESDSRIAACQPKMLDYANRHLFEYAGAAGGWIDRFGYPFCRGRVFDTCEEDKGQYDNPVPLFWASGAAMFVRATVFHELGGFDPYYFAHQEEIDLCWRMQRKGYLIYACPAAVIYHVGGGTLPRANPKKVFLNFRNNLVLITRYFSWRERLMKIPLRICLDAASALKNLLSGDSGYFFAVMRAYIAYLGWIFKRGKKLIPKAVPGIKLLGVYNGNIAWDYFIKHKRTFSEITGQGK